MAVRTCSTSTKIRQRTRIGSSNSFSYLWPRWMRTPTRDEVESLIEGLISFLDAIDGDADLEPEEAETAAREWCGSGAHRFDVGAAA